MWTSDFLTVFSFEWRYLEQHVPLDKLSFDSQRVFTEATSIASTSFVFCGHYVKYVHSTLRCALRFQSVSQTQTQTHTHRSVLPHAALTLNANLRVMLSDGSTGRIRKLSNGKLPNTVSSFSSVEEGKIKSENQRNGRKKDRELPREGSRFWR